MFWEPIESVCKERSNFLQVRLGKHPSFMKRKKVVVANGPI